ncbi:MAG TPA: adenosylmethionine--8-amino-7-oxononanoate transaminase [Chlamydiales bacterium]|nr:adenosylmethionine--8-amino-7-oxononanoate transaminase [Chlamydiales bacterium]
MKNLWHPFTQMKDQSFPEVLSAKGLNLYLKDGKVLKDMISSWWVILHGHCEESISEAIAMQAKQLEQVIFANFSHLPAKELTSLLQEFLPEELNSFFFSDNGSTAVEVALKMAYQYHLNIGNHDKKEFIAFEGAYHGDTIGAMSVGSRSMFSKPFNPLLFDVKRVSFPSTFENDPDRKQKEKNSIQHVEKLLSTHQIAALIIEPLIQGAAGMRICSIEYLQTLSKLCKKYDTIVIYDEVMTGFGRTGELFSFIKAKTVPDIVCVSKGITGGFIPLGLTIASETIYKGFLSDDPLKAFYHGHSYTANPIACQAAIASLKLLKEKPLYKEIESWHRKYIQMLSSLPFIKNIRVVGTMMAFDIFAEDEGYLSTIGKRLQKNLYEKGIYIRPLGNTIYLLPPYCIKKEELEEVYTRLKESMESIFSSKSFKN